MEKSTGNEPELPVVELHPNTTFRQILEMCGVKYQWEMPGTMDVPPPRAKFAGPEARRLAHERAEQMRTNRRVDRTIDQILSDES